ncbi:MAG: DUF1573 domain-containing protein [Flavobacterium sp.]
MKKMILFAAFAFFSLAANAQTAKKTATKKEAKAAKIDGAGMVFETETIDYGTVSYDSDGNREFVFTNNGNKPLKIESAVGSCGCTIPTVPKDSIFPGKKGIIKVHFDTKRAGQSFTKLVTVKSNAAGQETKVLTIKGNVLPIASNGEIPVKS